jgi:N-acyl-D-aspartate/D-glutamate deacylase
LLRYVREDQLVTLEQAVRKMTGQPASVFGFADRGILEVGKKADVVLFDPVTVGDRGTYERPDQYPDGIARVIVGGRTVWDGASLVPAGFPGRVLRRSP